MNKADTVTITGGAGFTEDALALEDLKEDQAPPFVEQDGVVYLRGSKSRSSGSLAFPVRHVCLETGARDMEPFLFGPDGTLYSYTAIHVSSTRPTPYTLGYVDFPNGVRVLAHVRESGADAPVACDQPVQLRADGANWFVVPVAAQSGV